MISNWLISNWHWPISKVVLQGPAIRGKYYISIMYIKDAIIVFLFGNKYTGLAKEVELE